jgi:hypothetical protein
MPFLFTVLRSVQYVKVEVPALEQAAVAVARRSAFCQSSLGHANLWRHIEQRAQKLEITIGMSNGMTGQELLDGLLSQ